MWVFSKSMCFHSVSSNLCNFIINGNAPTYYAHLGACGSSSLQPSIAPDNPKPPRTHTDDPLICVQNKSSIQTQKYVDLRKTKAKKAHLYLLLFLFPPVFEGDWQHVISLRDSLFGEDFHGGNNSFKLVGRCSMWRTFPNLPGLKCASFRISS